MAVGIDGFLLHIKDWQAPIAVADPDGEDCPLIYVNDEFCELTGYQRDEVVGHNCRFLQNGEAKEGEREAIREAIVKRRSHSICLKNYRKDGSSFDNLIYLDPFYTPEGGAYMVGSQFEFDVGETLTESYRAARRRYELESAISPEARDRELSLTAEMIDLRRQAIKLLMDAYGKMDRLANWPSKDTRTGV
ncbi:MAG: PAS domain-containing protein [Pseudomonadota bacterium]